LCFIAYQIYVSRKDHKKEFTQKTQSVSIILLPFETGQGMCRIYSLWVFYLFIIL